MKQVMEKATMITIIAEELVRQAHRCTDLAEEIQKEGGLPLSLADRETIRAAMVSWVSVCMSEAKLFFLAGSVKDFERGMATVANMLEMLSESR